MYSPENVREKVMMFENKIGQKVTPKLVPPPPAPTRRLAAPSIMGCVGPAGFVPSYNYRKMEGRLKSVTEENRQKDIIIKKQKKMNRSLKRMSIGDSKNFLQNFHLMKEVHHQLESANKKDQNIINMQAQMITLLKNRMVVQEKTIKNLEKKVKTLSYAQDMSDKILTQQRELTTSLQALANKQKKSKLISGCQSLVYTTSEPQPVVRDEMGKARARVRMEEESASINRLALLVDEIAVKYSRTNRSVSSHPTNMLMQQALHPDHLPEIVPREFLGLWTYVVEPTEVEELSYDVHLQQSVRPPVIHSPPFYRPTVNWSRLNKHHLKNLPEPEFFPVSSVPADPEFYSVKYPKRYNHRCIGGKNACGCVRCDPPFGRGQGLETNLGIISMPTEPVHGYIWTGKWVIAAMA